MINSFLFIYIVNIGGKLININDHIGDRGLRHWLILISLLQTKKMPDMHWHGVKCNHH